MSIGIPIISTFEDKGIKAAIKEFQQLETNTEKLGAAAQAGAKIAAIGFAALAASAAAAGAVLFKAAQAAAEDQRAQEQLASQLKATTTANDIQIKGVEDFIDKTQRASGVADDKLRPALGRLAAATGNVSEAQDLLNIALDLSAATGKSVETVSNALAKAQEGSYKAIENLGVGYEKGEVKATVKAVKERELPAVDDAFAKLASEFDTLAELKADFVVRLERVKKMEQGAQARDRLVEKLLAENEIPVPDNLVELEVNDHLEGEGRMEDAEHRAEVDGQVRSSLKSDFLLDAIVQAEDVQITEIELTEYLVRTSQRYGMAPQQFAEELQKAGQIQQLVAEVTRAKALASVLGRITVKDASGNVIDLEALAPKADPADLVEQA